MTSACCGPNRAAGIDERTIQPQPEVPFAIPARDPHQVVRNMVYVPAGRFSMGGDDPDAFPSDGEGPVRSVDVDAFWVDPLAVSNAQFATFVKATGYVTDAERIGWSFVFHLHMKPTARQYVIEGVVPQAPWWLGVRGAAWKAPQGPGSSIAILQRHPVVHVSWADAMAYARWSGKRLPTEAEWEKAARGGLERARFPWGNELFARRGRHRCNIWQGVFPTVNTAEDGYAGTAPVDAYLPNGYGLYNVAGNVWEWCNDWWSNEWHAVERPEARDNPQGPQSGDEKVIRGGSYLCHVSYCNRYRVAARTKNTPDTSTGNMGFRCAADVPPG